MKTLIINILALLFGFSSFAQKINSSVFANGGGFAKGQGASLSFTIGETFVTSVKGDRNLSLHQGFQQSTKLLASKPKKEVKVTADVKIFPNPTTDFVNVSIENDKDDNTYKIEIFDLMGRKIYMPTSKSEMKRGEKISIDFTNTQPGQYFIRLVSVDQPDNVVSFKIIKQF